MKELFKNILKFFGIYHPLQYFYRQSIFSIRRIINRVRYKKYKGRGYKCNVCNSMYERFIPDQPSSENRDAIESNNVIAGYGENILCPFCRSNARERLVIAMLGNENISGKKTLHLSPEKNIYNYLRQHNASVITTDISPGFYKAVDTSVSKEDATALSFDDHFFDLVIGNHILEHITEDAKAMAEIYRVLKPGGMAILQIPYSETLPETLEGLGSATDSDRAKMFGQKDHVRIYALKDYVQRLRKTGLEVEIIPYSALSEYYIFAIQKDECFLKIKKPFIA